MSTDKTLCRLCHKEPRQSGGSFLGGYCAKCDRLVKSLYNRGQSTLLVKPVNNPEAYYTEASVELDCPLCFEDKCAPGIPLCPDCLFWANKGKWTNWQYQLEVMNIQVPDKEYLQDKANKYQWRKCWDKNGRAGVSKKKVEQTSP